MAAQRYAAFLRAINVGGRRLAMETLRNELQAIGLYDVSTYIASGNALFSSKLPPAEAERCIEDRLGQALGFIVETFVRTATEVAAVAELVPFEVAEDDSHYVGFVREEAPAGVKQAVEALSNGTDLLVVTGREVHHRVHGRLTNSTIKPAVLGRALDRQPITFRNTTMLRKLAPLLGA
jgi:uncharacterized protein (DUF1697 family)